MFFFKSNTHAESAASFCFSFHPVYRYVVVSPVKGIHASVLGINKLHTALLIKREE